MVTLMAIHTVIRMGTATRMTKGSIPPFRVLFVCLGNICRSPTAHGVFRAKARAAGLDVVTDCAGTGGWHIGQPPDRRAVRAAAARGYDLSDLRARQITPADFARHDLILVMDRSNLTDVEALRPKGNDTPVRLFCSTQASGQTDIPDPYYTEGFDQVLDLIETCADDLVQKLRS